MIVPLLERLRKKLASTPEAIYADAAIQNLNELVYPFAQSLDAWPAATPGSACGNARSPT